jgi:hypothetical protein
MRMVSSPTVHSSTDCAARFKLVRTKNPTTMKFIFIKID